MIIPTKVDSIAVKLDNYSSLIFKQDENNPNVVLFLKLTSNIQLAKLLFVNSPSARPCRSQLVGIKCAAGIKTTTNDQLSNQWSSQCLSQNTAMEGDAVLERMANLERLVLEKFAEMKADNEELRQTLQKMGERLDVGHQASKPQEVATHRDAIDVDAPAEREPVDIVLKKVDPPKKRPQMGEEELHSSAGGKSSVTDGVRADKEIGGAAEKAKKGGISRRVAKDFLDEGIRQNSRDSNGSEKQNGG